MQGIKFGNAQSDGRLTKQWIVGHFMPEGDLRHAEEVEIKWGVHKKDEIREHWKIDEKQTSIAILVSGDFTIIFHETNARLNKPGDYVMWGGGVDHRWKANEDSIIVTVRWPSLL